MRRNEGTMCTGTRSIIINIKRRSIDCFFARAGGGTVRQTRERNHHCNSSQASSFIINLKDAIDDRLRALAPFVRSFAFSAHHDGVSRDTGSVSSEPLP